MELKHTQKFFLEDSKIQMIAKLKISQIFVKNAEIQIEETLHIQQEIDFYTVFLLYLFTMCSFKI